MNKEEFKNYVNEIAINELRNSFDNNLMETLNSAFIFKYVETLEQENQELKKELEEKNKPQIFIDTQDIEERYAEGLYQDYLEEENKKYKNQQKEFIEWLESERNINPYDISDYHYEKIINTILSKYYEIIEK